MMWFSSYAENPKTVPAARAGQNCPVRRRHSTNAAQADTGIEAATSRLNDTTGPAARVSGAAGKASEGIMVTHARGCPVGAPTSVVWYGLSPCAIA